MKHLLKSKKGIAMESAVAFLMIIFTFCFLLSSLALYGHYQIKIENVQMQHFVDKEQIGEEYVAYMNTASPDFATYLAENNIEYENYACEEVKTQDADITRYELTVKRGTGDSAITVLYVKAEKSAEGQVTLLSWRTTQPATVQE